MMTIDKSGESHEAPTQRTRASCTSGSLRLSAAMWGIVLLTACGGGGGSAGSGGGGGSSGGGSGGQSYTVGGMVSGLVGAGLVLQNNGGDDLALSSSGSFTFATRIASGANYSVSIKTQPSNPTQTCALSSASGTIGSSDVTSVSLTCTTNAYTVSGTVSGLSADAGLVLQNGTDELTPSHNGSFVFAMSVLSGALYNVTVKTQPTTPVQNCVVLNASGTMGSAGVSNVAVSCDGIALLAGALGGPGTRDGPGNTARFNRPNDVARDSVGNLYVADRVNNTIRKITFLGVTTFAGTPGQRGSADGVGSAARFAAPTGIVVDSADNVYVADSSNHTIRKITPAGVVSTLAGGPSFGSADGTGSAARFKFPNRIAIDASGNLYVADTSNHTIRKVTAAGVVTTVAGTAGQLGSVDGTGSAARFKLPAGIATDATGNLYVSDTNNHTIRKITPAGVVSTLAGTAGVSGSADGTGGAAQFTFPRGLATDPAGNVYVASRNAIRRITPAGEVSTFAGMSTQIGSVDGSGNAARFSAPFGISIDATGNAYVADTDNNTIRKITSTALVTTVAGAAAQADTVDGTGKAARLYDPNGIATDSAGNVYVAESYGNTIRKITPAGVVSTLAGLALQTGAEDGSGTAARFSYPIGVATDSAANVYVADNSNGTIRKITAAGVVSTLAGTPGQFGSMDGSGSAARFDTLKDVAADALGNVYAIDIYAIRKITPDGVVSTLAGVATQSGSTDGSGSAALFSNPQGLATDSAGNVYVADTSNHTIRKITPAGVVSTLAGTAGMLGFVDGNSSTARFNNPNDIAVDSAGNIYVAEPANDAIRQIAPDGTVTTVAGTNGVEGIRLGTLPGSLNESRYIAVLPGPRLTLVETNAEKAVLMITLP